MGFLQYGTGLFFNIMLNLLLAHIKTDDVRFTLTHRVPPRKHSCDWTKFRPIRAEHSEFGPIRLEERSGDRPTDRQTDKADYRDTGAYSSRYLKI